MKIAVACENESITQHFGHCEGFMVFDVDDHKIIRQEMIPNPGHRPGFLPNFLHEKGVNIIISGGMGGSAIQIFNQHNIEVITGAMGNVREVVEEYLKGNLESTGSVCHEHQHRGDCH